MGEDDEGGCQGVQSKPEVHNTSIFQQQQWQWRRLPDDIDEFEDDEDGHAILPFEAGYHLTNFVTLHFGLDILFT